MLTGRMRERLLQKLASSIDNIGLQLLFEPEAKFTEPELKWAQQQALRSGVLGPHGPYRTLEFATFLRERRDGRPPSCLIACLTATQQHWNASHGPLPPPGPGGLSRSPLEGTEAILTEACKAHSNAPKVKWPPHCLAAMQPLKNTSPP
ncbi:Hypothetical predicted protein [Pelobates cultripes]|uniref:Uncharacterized protein n=1 Tax=Pelobates cultripes TaxID=61616 RepID=A0AAD1RF87_PELCU|nr:Hypothetical predicted protein [Pelobates cultripes]